MTRTLQWQTNFRLFVHMFAQVILPTSSNHANRGCFCSIGQPYDDACHQHVTSDKVKVTGLLPESVRTSMYSSSLEAFQVVLFFYLLFLLEKKQLIIMNFRQVPIFLEKKIRWPLCGVSDFTPCHSRFLRSGKEAQIPRVGPWNAGSVGGVEGKRTYDDLEKSWTWYGKVI